MQALSCLDRLLPRVADLQAHRALCRQGSAGTHVRQTRQPRTHGCSGSSSRSLQLAQRRSAPMRAAQLRSAMLWALCSVAAAQEGVPRRGPPRGPIKEDKSTFFGKEGDQSRSVRQPAVRTAAASRPRPRRRRAVARAVASKAYSDLPYHAQVAARGQSFYAIRPHGLRAAPRRPRFVADLRDDGHC